MGFRRIAGGAGDVLGRICVEDTECRTDREFEGDTVTVGAGCLYHESLFDEKVVAIGVVGETGGETGELA